MLNLKLGIFARAWTVTLRSTRMQLDIRRLWLRFFLITNCYAGIIDFLEHFGHEQTLPAVDHEGPIQWSLDRPEPPENHSQGPFPNPEIRAGFHFDLNATPTVSEVIETDNQPNERHLISPDGINGSSNKPIKDGTHGKAAMIY
ncbi:hypothetical protein PtA15_11A139 [Puccinia triticina]|uniref:Uncharacterized protein n=1 Tax=Puccinia triticina TaxID=208348 RepID=A0ABY7CVY9_9BASI|nr:uncharacterized protein PtA15_11A139 [Puccinia triticina]WAQ89451.1 hypothetical protein PtA15_11A139 [Puccinia triticina]